MGEKPKGRVIFFATFQRSGDLYLFTKRRKALEIIKSSLECGAEALDICSGAEM